jgi:hypothetical protein
MSRRLIAIAVFAGLLFASPRSTEASMLDFIWELSGPQLIGLGVSCRWDFNKNVDVCDFAPATRSDGAARSRLFFTTSGTVFVSTSKNSPSKVDYNWGDVYMLAAEPSVSVSLTDQQARVRVYHSVGVSYDVLLGKRFDTFDKFGVKITPVEVYIPAKHLSLAATIRIYPNGFSNDEFGIGNRRDYDRPAEAVYGFTVGYWFKNR